MGWQKRLQQCSLSTRLPEGFEERKPDGTPLVPTEHVDFAFSHAGEAFVASLSGALYWPEQKTLLVADLHLEKGSAFARLGQFLPPYDSLRTLDQLALDIGHFKPQKVICLGDSFHDVDGPKRMAANVTARLHSLTAAQEWIWLTGNHDPVLSDPLGGVAIDAMTLASSASRLALCHEPGGSQTPDSPSERQLEICGHLHPAARIPARGRTLRCKCFVLTDERIIMPAYGSYTGGLELDDEAFQPFLSKQTKLLVIGRKTLAMHDASISVPRRRR
ncbi:ligase-associated DNA damage response endonuclease PdeM [uncultured Cohaesibacter sp.]|uniref:ligase-associated DNA damage response endonuclease PdeM n=1 Tax=uncultured Cohaesibacter sp. TaxID=1002546 RepID=UPI0029C83732|nr:ligase-associated DNA damage response endonuclease PdeM [uncultured Cohaesibacter sp.]